MYIKKIINQSLYDNASSIIMNGIFDYNPNKINIISFMKNQEEFEIIDKDFDEDLKNKKDILINLLDEEKKRIIKILEFFIVNIDIHKIQLPFYKTYDYDNISNHMKTKVRKHINNNFFDIVNFNIKNGIKKNKEFIIENFSLMTNINKDELSKINDFKLAIYYILIQIIDLFNIYLKSIHYSIELINENPSILNDNYKDYIIDMDNKFFNITNDEINIFHHNLIKNAFKKFMEKDKMIITSSTIIKIKKNSNKNYEIFFK